MNKFLLCLYALVPWVAVPSVIAHVKSEQMAKELNAAPPKWLSIGIPIKVTPVTSPPNEQTVFRPRSGGATNSRNRVQIPDRGIQIELDYEIDWTGNNEAGTGVSLSPDGKRLLINSGPTSHLYDIQANGNYREIALQLPHVTYDMEPKGFLRKGSWAGDHTLVAQAEITDETGHEIIDNRIYVFHMKERVLSRLDLSALNLTETAGIKVVGIGSELSQLKLSVGSAFVIVKADLKSPPKVEKLDAYMPKIPPSLVVSEQSTAKAPEAQSPTTSDETVLLMPWILVSLVIAVVLGLGWWLLKKRK